MIDDTEDFIDRNADAIRDGMLVSKWSGAFGVDMATLPAEERTRIANEIIDMREWLDKAAVTEYLISADTIEVLQ